MKLVRWILRKIFPRRVPADIRSRVMNPKKDDAKDSGKKDMADYKSIPFDPIPEVERPGYITRERYNPAWFSDEGAPWTDTLTGKKMQIRVAECVHYVPTEQGSARVTLKRNQVMPYFRNLYRDNAIKNGISVTESSDRDWGMFDGGSKPEDLKNYPFQPGPFTIQMYTYDFWKMLSIVHTLVNYNPLAKAGVAYKAAFTMGSGPKITTKKGFEQLQDKWDLWTQQVKWLDRWRVRARSIIKNGNLILQAGNDKMGQWKVKTLYPGKLYDQVTEPDDCEIVYGYVLMYPTKYQTYGQGAKGEQVPLTEFRFETIPPDNILHLKLNVEEDEVWGRSDLMPVLDICQWFMSYLKASTLQVFKQAQFSWDVLLKNADSGDVATMTQQLSDETPVTMGNFVHNENVDRKPLESSGGSSGRASRTFEEIVTAFAVGFMQAKEYLGVGESGTRATAVTATEPTMKTFLELRSILETGMRWEFERFCLWQGIPIQSANYEVTWPELVPENSTEKIANYLTGYMNRAFTHRRFCEAIAKELDVRAYNYEDEQKERAQEQAQAASNDVRMNQLYPPTVQPSPDYIDPQANVPPKGAGGAGPGQPPPEQGGAQLNGGVTNQIKQQIHQQGQL